MLKKLRRGIRATYARQSTRRSPERKIRFEALESRFLLSAEIAIPPPDPNPDTNAQQLEQTELTRSLVVEEQQQIQELDRAVADPGGEAANQETVAAESDSGDGASGSTGESTGGASDEAADEQPAGTNAADDGKEGADSQAGDAEDRDQSSAGEASEQSGAEEDADGNDDEAASAAADQPPAETAPRETAPPPAAASLLAHQPREIVFVDPDVKEYQDLLDELLDPSRQQTPVAGEEPAPDNAGTAIDEFIAPDQGAPDGEAAGLLSVSGDADKDLQQGDGAAVPAPAADDDRLVVVLDAARDGIDQISEVLQAYEGVAAVHILSHGSNANLRLGSATLNAGKLKQYSDRLKAWGRSLTPDADILLYGCEIAKDATGVKLVQDLGALTGADVAASNDDTGGAEAGGDWVLEVSTGVIETTPLFGAAGPEAYPYLLADYPIAGTDAGDIFTINANSVQRSDAAVPTVFATGDSVAVNATTIADTAGTPGSDVFDVEAFPTAQQADPASGSFTVYGGEDTDALDLSAVGADLTFTFDSSGAVLVSDGVYDLVAVDIEEIIAGTGANTFVFGPGAVYSGAIVGSGDDTFDFAAYDGLLTFAGGSIRNADASLDITHSEIENINVSLDQVNVTDATDALTGGLSDLVDWANDLQEEGAIGQTLAGLGANVGVTLGNGIGIAESIDQLRLEIKALVDAAQAAGDDVLAQDIQDLLDGFNQTDIQYAERAIVGDVFDPAIGGGDSFGFDLELREGDTTTSTSITVAGNPDLTTFVDNINGAINADSDLRSKVRAIEVTQDDGGTEKSRIAFQVVSPDVDELTLAQSPASSTDIAQLGFAATQTIGGLEDEIEDLGALDVAAAGVTAELSFVGGLPELVFAFDYNASRSSEFNIDLGKGAEDLGLTFDASETVGVISGLNAGLGLGLSLDADADFFFNLDDLAVSAASGSLAIDSDIKIGFLAASASGSFELQADVVSVPPALDHENPADRNMPALGDGAQDFFDLDLTVAIDEGRVSGLDTFNDPGSELTIAVTGGDPLRGRDVDITYGNFDNLGRFGEFNAASFVSQVGSVRDWFASVRDSDILKSVDIPFATSGLDSVFDLADAVGDTLLYDDADDGEDGDATLVVDLRSALAEADLEDKLRVEGDGARITFSAKDSSITFISVTGGSDIGFDGTEVFDDGALTGSNDATPVLGADTTFRIRLVENGQPNDYDVTLAATATENNDAVGNDHARLLDENDAPTFETTQELADRLFEIIGIEENVTAAYDTDSKRLTFALTFDSDYAIGVPVDFDFDLSPIGNIGTAGSPDITLGAGIDLSLTLGLDLSDQPPGTEDLAADTELTELNSIDDLTEAIKTEFALSPEQAPATALSDADQVEIAFVDSGAEMTGSPRLTFADSGDADTITRSGGSWLTDGFRVEQQISVTGTGSNNGSFTIAAISGDGLTLTLADGDELQDEVKGGAEVTGAAPTLQENPDLSFSAADGTITRSEGSWIEDGFRNPDGSLVDYIVVEGAGANNGVYQIDAVSGDGRTLTLAAGAALTSRADVGNVTVAVPDRIRLDAGGNWAADGFRAGQLITVSGTQSNNRTFLIADVVEGGEVLMLSAAAKAANETLNEDADLRVSGGAVVRLSENATFSIDGVDASGPVEVTVLAQPGGEVSFVSDTSDNNNLLDLANDINSALEEAGIGNKIQAELSNGRLLLTARTELADNPVLDFFPGTNTISRDEGSWLDDGFTVGQIIRLSGSSSNDGIAFTIDAVDDTTLTLSGNVLNAEAASRDIAVVGTSGFTLTTAPGDTAATEIGFEPGQTADSADLLITVSDSSLDPYRVTLDGATTIQDVIDDIEAQTFGNVRAEVDPDSGTGLRLVQVPALTGNPRLTFDTTGNAIIREDGRLWSDDHFAAAQTIRVSGADEGNDGVYEVTNIVDIGGRDALIVTKVSGGTVAVDEQSVKDVRITLNGDEIFRVEAVNGSKAAARLGILKADVSTDVDNNGKVEVADSDGIIIGDAIAGASLLDRFFIQDPTVEGRVFVDARDDESTARANDGMVVTGDFGFVSVDLIGSGAFETRLTLGLDDPTPTVEGITVNELIGSLSYLGSIVAAPTIGGAQVSGEDLEFDGKSIVRTNNELWADDDFSIGEYISISGAAEQNNGQYRIADIQGSRLTVEAEEDFAAETVTTATVLDEIGAFELILDVSPDFGLIGDDAVSLALALFDFGNPFADTDFTQGQFTVGEDGDSFTLTGDRTDRIRPGAGVVAELAAVTFGGTDASKLTESSFAVTGDQRGRFELGAKVNAVLADTTSVTSKIRAVNYSEGTGATTFIIEDDVLTDDLSEVSIASKDVVTLVLAASYDADADQTTVTVVGEVLSDEVSRVSVDTPRDLNYLLELPDLGDLVKFDQIDIGQIIDGLIELSDFLADFEAFGFLSDPIPVINVSINDVLAFADRFDAAVQEAQNNPAGTLQVLEGKLKEALGVPSGVDSDALGFFEPQSSDTGLLRGDAISDAQVADMTRDAVFLISLDNGPSQLIKVATGDADTVDELVVNVNAALSAAFATNVQARKATDPAGDDFIEFFTPDGRALAISNPIDLSIYEDGDLELFRMDFGLGIGFTEALDVDFDLGDVGVLSGSAGLEASGAVDFALGLGIDLNDPSDIYLFDSSITGQLSAVGDDLAFRAGIGPLGVFVNDGEVGVGGDIGNKLFSLGLDFDGDNATREGRKLISDVVLEDDFSAELSGAIAADLPVYFPAETLHKGSVTFQAGLSVDESGNLETVSDLGALDPDGNATKADGTEFTIDDLFDIDLSELTLMDNMLLAVDGLDSFLGGLQDVLDGEVFGVPLPLIGDKLSDGARFIEDFRDDFIEPFREEIENLAVQDENIVSELLFDLLGPGGISLLLDTNDDGAVTIDDIILDTNIDEADGDLQNDYMQWNMELGQELELGTGIDLDLGIPGLGLETRGDVNLELGWNLGFGFGISFEEAFYLDISDDSELEVGLDVTLPDFGLTGELAFLQLDGRGNKNAAGEDISHFSARFGIDVNNQNAATDERLAFSELGSIGLEPGIAGEAVVDLGFELKLNSELAPGVAGVFPKVVTDFFLDWSIDGDEDAAGLQLKPFSELEGESALNLVKGGLSLVEFQDVSLDLGSFISDFIDPVLGTVREVTEPLQPIIDFLTAPLPVISDLGPDLTILDLAEMTGKVDTGFIESVAGLITFVNAIPLDAETVLLNFGDFTIYDSLDPELSDLDITDPTEDVQNKVAVPRDRTGVEETPGGGDPSGTKTKRFTDKIKSAGDFDFPIINDPTQIFNLLLGKDAVLMTYDLKPLVAEFSFKQSFPVYPPLYVAILGEIAAEADFAFGFDTAGIAEFADTGFRNPLVIFNGFYVSDTDLPTGEFGTDVPELTLSGFLGAAAELNLGIASAGVGGGVGLNVFFDLFDPSRDGKVRVPEMINSIVNEFRYGSPALAPLALFDVSGEVFAKLFAYIEFLFFEYEFDITPPITLLEFDIPFTRAPTLATDIGDGVLQVNIGEFASQRLNNNTEDGDETFVITGSGSTVNVAATFGGTTFVQTYNNVSKILALGGEGNDTIDLSGLASASIEFELEGGVGDDRIILSDNAGGDAFIDGGIGDDVIIGGAGDDEIYGGAGNDTITGGGGRDTIFGDEGEIAFQEDETGAQVLDYTRSRVKLTDGDDVIDGGAGDDKIFGGGGEDDIDGGADGDLIIGDGAILREVLRITARNEVADFELAEDAALELVIDGESFLVTLLAADTSGNTTIEELVGDINDQLAEDGVADRVTAGHDGDRLQFRAAAGVLELRVKGANDAATSTLGFTPFFKKALVLDDVNRGDGKADTLRGGAGDDVVYGGRGDDTLRGGGDDDRLFGGEGFDLLYGDAGNDRLLGGEDDDELSGGAGDDHIEGGAGHDILWGDWRVGEAVAGDAGVDSLWGDTGADTMFGGAEGDFLFGGSDPDLVFGEQGDDTLDGGHGADRLFGGLDNDTVISSLGDDFIDGGSGSDDTIINTLGGDMSSLLTLFDSGAPIGDGVDTLIVNGTEEADRFLLRAARADVFDATLNDVNAALSGVEDELAAIGVIKSLQLDLSTLPPRASIAKLNSEGNVERINYYDNMESIIVNGLEASDRIVSDNTNAEVTVNGGDGDDLFQVGQLFNSPRDADAGIDPYDVFDTVQTTKGFLSSGINAAMTINGEDGSDSFVVFRNLAVLTLNGGDGDDEFLVKAFALEGSVDDPDRDLTDITGAGGADLIQYAVNAPVGINGGDGLDTVIVLGTEFGDDFVVTEQGVFGAGLNVNFAGIEILKLDTAEGNDRIFVLGTGPDHITEVFAGEGSDAYFIGGDAPPVVSQDLLGHSGLIAHEASSGDGRFDGVNVDGISANVGDNDEPFIRIIKDDGLLRVAEDGTLTATYSMVLTREPRGLVGVAAIAPRPSPNEARNGIEYLQVNGGQAAELIFTPGNWFTPQTIEVTATPDLAYEGSHIGTINHLVTQFPVPEAPNYDNMAIPSVTVEVVDDDLPGLVIQPSDGDARAVEGAAFGAAAPFAHEYTVRLNQQPDSDVTVDLVNEDGQLELEQTRLTFTSSNWDTPQTVRVIAADDAVNEGFHYGYIEHRVGSTQGDVTVNDFEQTFGAVTEAQARSSVLLDYAPIDKDAIDSVVVGGELREPELYRLDGKQLTLIDEIGQPVAVTDEIVVTYDYIKPGFQDAAAETVGVQIGDNDAPGVLVMQGGGSTNVIEADATTPGSGAAPFTDQYQLVLTARPDSDVVIDVAPQPTKTSGRPPFVFTADVDNAAVTELGFAESSDPTISLTSGNPAPEDGRLGGDLVFEIDLTPNDNTDAATQVTVAQAETAGNESIDDLIDDINAALQDAGLEEKIFAVRDESRIVIAKAVEPQREQVSVSADTLTFTPDNWDIPQTVTVTAINDDFVDGGETKVFAPIEQTVARIQGPLIIEGGGGEGSDAGLGDDPLRLPGESNDVGNVVEVPTDSEGNVLANQVVLDGEDIDKLGPTYFRSLDTFEPGDEDDDTKAKVILMITSGPGAGQERVVVARNENTFILAEDWNSGDLPTGDSRYIFIRELGSVNEAEQVDVATVFNHESVADNTGTLTATRLYGLGMGPDIELDGVTWPGGLTYADLENLTIHMGRGDDSLAIYGTHNRDDFRTVTIVNTGAGDDNVTAVLESEGGRVAAGSVDASRANHLQDLDADFPTEGRGLSGYLARVTDADGNVQERTILFNDGDTLYLDDAWVNIPQAGDSYEIVRHAAGLISINTQSGDDLLDGAASTAPLIAFGGLGADTLTGGEGDDILIGDRGQIDYIDGDGNVVTRLGSNDIPAPRMDNPEDPDNPIVIFRQTDGVFRDPAFIKSIEPDNGGNDRLTGGAGNDLLIGGARADALFGGSGDDVLIGDGGQKVLLGAGREYYETIDNFIGGVDFLAGGDGNDILFGGFGGDQFGGPFDGEFFINNLNEDILLGEYGRVTLQDSTVAFVLRLGQGSLDLAGSTLFSLYGVEPYAAQAVPVPGQAAEALAAPEPIAVSEEAREEARFATHHAAIPEELPAPGAVPRPEHHVVTRNDTLWDLAETYLGAGWRWPEIWEMNPQIEDPDLIFPGMRLKLPEEPIGNETGQEEANGEQSAPADADTDARGIEPSPSPEREEARIAVAGLGLLAVSSPRPSRDRGHDLYHGGPDGALVFDEKGSWLQPYYRGVDASDRAARDGGGPVIEWERAAAPQEAVH